MSDRGPRDDGLSAVRSALGSRWWPSLVVAVLRGGEETCPRRDEPPPAPPDVTPPRTVGDFTLDRSDQARQFARDVRDASSASQSRGLAGDRGDVRRSRTARSCSSASCSPPAPTRAARSARTPATRCATTCGRSGSRTCARPRSETTAEPLVCGHEPEDGPVNCASGRRERGAGHPAVRVGRPGDRLGPRGRGRDEDLRSTASSPDEIPRPTSRRTRPPGPSAGRPHATVVTLNGRAGPEVTSKSRAGDRTKRPAPNSWNDPTRGSSVASRACDPSVHRPSCPPRGPGLPRHPGCQPALVVAPRDPGRLRERGPRALGVRREGPGQAPRQPRARPGSRSSPATRRTSPASARPRPTSTPT